MNKINVSVVLLNYNRENDLVECLQSLNSTKYPFKEIVVVDNGSKDQSVARVQNEFRNVSLLLTGKNLGYTGGMNAGIKYVLKSSPKYILLLNCDTIVEKDFVSLLVLALERDQNRAIATGTIYYYENRMKVWFAGGNISFWRGTGVCRHDVPMENKIGTCGSRKVTFVSGCGLLVRSDVLIELGAFDERLFMYYEDAELSVRFRKHGYDLIHVPSARMYHKVNEVDVKPYQIYYGTRNRLFFLRYVLSGPRRIVAFIYMCLTWFFKMIYWFIANRGFYSEARNGIRDFMHMNISRQD